jgi:predicted Zn-dependent protease
MLRIHTLLPALALILTLAAPALAAPLPDTDNLPAWSALYKKTPDDPAVALGFAQAALAAGRTQEAINAYERLLKNNPQHPLAALLRARLAQLHQDMNKQAEASAYWQGYVDASRAIRPFTQERMEQPAASSPWQVHGRLYSGVLFDSNANAGPSSDNM